MKGIQFKVDEHGNPNTLVLDLDDWGEIWEDFYFGWQVDATKNEPTLSWEEVMADLDANPELECDDIEDDCAIEGTQFLIDESGKPKSVIIDLDEHEERWEGIYDELIEEGNLLIGRNVVSWKETKAEIRANVERERGKYRD